MRIQTARLTAGVLLACAAFVAQTSQAASPTTAPSTPSTQASTASSLEAEQDAAFKAAKAVQKVGPVDITLRDQAHLHLPAGYVWVPTPAAAQLMRSMGNRTDDTFIGAIFPADDADWMAVVKFVKEGYIKDDDAKDWNADDLLKSLKEGTEAANEERAKRGIPSIEVTGWAQKPQYDASSHRLVWSALSKRAGSGLSRSSTATTLPSMITGTTTSEALAASQAMWPGKACTSSTSCVSPLAAAAPQTPLPRGMRMQAVLPWKGPRTSSSSAIR